MAYEDQYLIEEILQEKDSVKIIFRHLAISNHKRITDIFSNPNFTKSISGNIRMKNFTVTTGGFETRYGFQYTILGHLNPQAGKKVEYDATEYPVRLKRR